MICRKHLMLSCEHYSEYTPTSSIIHLDRDLRIQQKEEPLIYEILEAINHIFELNFDHDNQFTRLSVVLHQIIIDNPSLIKSFFAKK